MRPDWNGALLAVAITAAALGAAVWRLSYADNAVTPPPLDRVVFELNINPSAVIASERPVCAHGEVSGACARIPPVGEPCESQSANVTPPQTPPGSPRRSWSFAPAKPGQGGVLIPQNTAEFLPSLSRQAKLGEAKVRGGDRGGDESCPKLTSNQSGGNSPATQKMAYAKPLLEIDAAAVNPIPAPLEQKQVSPVMREALLYPQAWMKYASPPPDTTPLPMIAIVIDDVGINPARATDVLSLPAAVTLAVLPYARDAAGIAARAREHGHEVLVHLPMEGRNGSNPGPRALTHALSPDEFSANLEWNLSRFIGYVGVNNHMGSRLTQDNDAMEMLHKNLRRRGLLFLDSRTTARTVAANTARLNGLVVLERDVFLDNSVASENIHAQLRKAEMEARGKGYAIAIGHPHVATIGAVRIWARDLEARGFSLVPLSTLTRISATPQTVARH